MHQLMYLVEKGGKPAKASFIALVAGG